ncbi:unnamed protein product [Boreogadus saida]
MCLRTPDDDVTLTEGAGETKVRHDFKDRLKAGDQTLKDNQRLQISVSPSSESVSLSRTTFMRCVGESGSDHSRTSRKAHSPPGTVDGSHRKQGWLSARTASCWGPLQCPCTIP